MAKSRIREEQVLDADFLSEDEHADLTHSGINHSLQTNLGYSASGHTGFVSTATTQTISGTKTFNGINTTAFTITTSGTPASGTATGTLGDICWDSNYLYICVNTNTWKKTLLLDVGDDEHVYV